MDFQNRLVAGEVGHPGFVELENGLGRFAGNPLGLGVAQGVQVEFRAFRWPVATGDGEIVEILDFRKPGTGGIQGGYVDGSDRPNELPQTRPALNPQAFPGHVFGVFPGLHLTPDRQSSPPHE